MSQGDSRLLIVNANVVNEGSSFMGWLYAEGEFIEALGEGDAPGEYVRKASEIVDAQGKYLLPGAIDEHVHFREPGLTQKADIASESRAAVVGGITSFLDMPNTRPLTVTSRAVDDKLEIAGRTSMANYGFFIGATNDNLDELLHADYSRTPGVKLFLGSSTGNMLVDRREFLMRLLNEVKAPIAVHAESESRILENRRKYLEMNGNPNDLPLEYHTEIRDRQACFDASQLIVSLAKETGARLHLMHVSTADELSLLEPGPVAGKRITAETCPQYLLFDKSQYAERGTRIKCNPAIKDASDSEALMQALKDGTIDCVGSDHAPHLLADKEGGALKAASGMPMLQFSLCVMMGKLSAVKVAEKMCHNPAQVFAIDRRGFLRPGYYADMVLVEQLPAPYTVSDDMVVSRCGWTPLRGMELRHRVASTWVNGRLAWDGVRFGEKSALPLKFLPK